MKEKMRKTGIDVLGEIPWGSHLCQFYETKEDLHQLLVPFFKAGIENNEFCLWIMFNPKEVDEAIEMLKASDPDLIEKLKKNSFEMVDYVTLYFRDGHFDEKIMYDDLKNRLQNALNRGYDGMRVHGNDTWLVHQNWDVFVRYERGLDTLVHDQQILLLCTYFLSGLDATTLLDMAQLHDTMIARRKGNWEIFEKPEIKKLKAQLQQRGDELEKRVTERTKEIQEANDRLRDLSAHLQNIREEERTRIAREIHDELGAHLTVLKLDASWLDKKLNSSDSVIKQKMKDLMTAVDATGKVVRRISANLRPGLLDQFGLAAAMAWYIEEFKKRSGITFFFHEPEEKLQIEDLTKSGLYSIFQESLTNIARHSGADKVWIKLVIKEDQILMSIKDNGRGFDKQIADKKKTLGILGMEERALMMGGNCAIGSIPENGTTVTVTVPIKKRTIKVNG
jgi:signal transduction histidine kinase